MKKILVIMLFVSLLAACSSASTKSIKSELEARDYECGFRVCDKTSTFTYLSTYEFSYSTSIHSGKQEVTQTTIYPTLADWYRLVEVYTFIYHHSSNKIESIEYELYHLTTDTKTLFNEGSLIDGAFSYTVTDQALSDRYFSETRLTNRLETMAEEVKNRWESNFNAWTE